MEEAKEFLKNYLNGLNYKIIDNKELKNGYEFKIKEFGGQKYKLYIDKKNNIINEYGKILNN